MDAITYELDPTESSIVAAVRDFVDPRGQAGRARARARQHLPREADRADEAARHLRPGHPRAVGRRAGVDPLLRAGHRGAGPRLDEPGRRDGRAHRGRQAARSSSAPRSRRTATCRGWRPARSGRRWRSPSRAAAPTCRRCARPPGATATTTSSTARRPGSPTPAAPSSIALLCKTDPDGRARRTAASASCSSSTGPGFTVSRDLPKLGYKGVESCELAFDDFRVPADARCSAASRARASRR